MHELLVRLQRKTFSEMRYFRGMQCMHEKRLVECRKVIATAERQGQRRAVARLIAEQTVLRDELGRLTRRLRGVTRRLGVLDAALSEDNPTAYTPCPIRRMMPLTFLQEPRAPCVP